MTPLPYHYCVISLVTILSELHSVYCTPEGRIYWYFMIIPRPTLAIIILVVSVSFSNKQTFILYLEPALHTYCLTLVCTEYRTAVLMLYKMLCYVIYRIYCINKLHLYNLTMCSFFYVRDK